MKERDDGAVLHLRFQERAGVKMILIQDGSQNPNMDKPLRIIGEPYKVQVLLTLSAAQSVYSAMWQRGGRLLTQTLTSLLSVGTAAEVMSSICF